MTTSRTIDLARLPEIIAPVYMDLRRCEKRYLVLMGGRNSGKSYYASQHMLLKLVSEPGHKIGVFRKIADSCRNSVFARVQSEISRWGLWELFTINLSNMDITYKPNGNKMLFFGMHTVKDREKLKSIEGLTDAWIEEATEFSERDVHDINLVIRGQAAFPLQLLLSFNPISYHHWLKKRFFTPEGHPRQDIAKAHVMVTTIRDNPWASESDLEELEALKEQDPELYEKYMHGRWTRMTGLIYDWPAMETEYPLRFDFTIGGIDWGFNNPLVFLTAGVKDQEHYLTQHVYESGLTTQAFLGRLEAMKVPRVGQPGAYPVYCDSAEPDRIRALQDAGYWALPAAKGPGSVRAGIDYCKSIKVHSCEANVDLNREFESYKWKTKPGPDGEIRDMPLEIEDHGMDAWRYAAYTHIGKPQETYETVVTTDLVEEFGDGLLPDILPDW